MTAPIQTTIEQLLSDPNYENIKKAAAAAKKAKAQGFKVADLLALAPGNDPFYCGGDADEAKSAWFRECFESGNFNKAHLRRVHYNVLSRESIAKHDGEPYENTDNNWKYLCQASKMARYSDKVDYSRIIDHKSPEPTINTDYSGDDDNFHVYLTLPDLKDIPFYIDKPAAAKIQPFHLELWVEKTTMNDVLTPICEKYGANLVCGEGEITATACYQFIKRVITANKPARIFYLSDFDPAGRSMPKAAARKIEFLQRKFAPEADIKVIPVLLTADQVAKYQLPRTPIKDTEKRAASFEARHGEGAVELDALEAIYPGELEQIIDGILSQYYSEEKKAEISERYHQLDSDIAGQIREITARYQDQISALKTMFEELREIRAEENLEVEPAEAVEPDMKNPFDID